MILSKYIYWKSNNTIYSLNSKETWYGKFDDENEGFSVQKVQAYPFHFILSDSMDSLHEEIKNFNHIQKYGEKDKVEFDAKCPKCGWAYTFDYMDYNDGYYTPAIKEDFSATIKCICGCKFIAKIKVQITFEVKEI